MNKLFTWKQKLKDKGIRWTNQRSNILKVLIDSYQPLSAKSIFSRVKNNNPKLRLSTVYRNLKYFETENIVRSLNFNKDEKKFELINGQHHHYLVCINCDEILALEECPLKEFEDKLKVETEYTILEHRMKMYGICPKCKGN